MLFYINPHLIADEVTGSQRYTSKSGITEDFDRVAVKTAGGATKLVEGKHVPSEIIICRHSISNEPGAKTRVYNATSEDGKIRTRIQTSLTNKYDDDVFVLALPYDGLIVPMEQPDRDVMSIWRYVVQKSSTMNIEHNDHKYRRVLYMVVSPRGTVDADGWYSDNRNLVIKTIKSNLGKNQEPNENPVWTVTIHTIRFGEGGAYDIHTETETVPYDVYAHIASDMRVPVVETVPPLPKREHNQQGQAKPASKPEPPKASNAPVKNEPDEGQGGGKKRRKKRHH